MAKDRSWIGGLDLMGIFSSVLVALTWAAKQTETVVDDIAVKILKLASEDAEIGAWLSSMLQANGAKARSAVAPLSGKAQKKLAKAGLDVGTIVQYLPMILDLLKRFRDRKQTK